MIGNIKRGIVLLDTKSSRHTPPSAVSAWNSFIEIDKAFSSTDRTVLQFKGGGKMSQESNLIPSGVLHKENNSIGDKGIPVVDKSGTKKMELEKEELILTADVTRHVDSLVDSINNAEDEEKDSLTEELGKYVTEQIQLNTKDESGRYKKLK